ncbi:hypothetical protein ACUHMQ_18285 [Chitinimonas sp. PSY-7]|uniref:hypothetical protein n=1 Tax=Chitinimonas sp. PSY-7 TaxID=3459088 RepID=UPI0040402A70
MPLSYRVHLSVFPLGSSEPPRVLAAIRTAWVCPYWVANREQNGAWLFEMCAEAGLPAGDDERAFAERISIAIWQRLGRYVKVVVDASPDESDESRRNELLQSDYLKLMRAH